MPEPSFTLILMIFISLLVISFWKQVLVLLLVVVVAVFCFGLYFLVVLLH